MADNSASSKKMFFLPTGSAEHSVDIQTCSGHSSTAFRCDQRLFRGSDSPEISSALWLGSRSRPGWSPAFRRLMPWSPIGQR